MKSCVLFVIGCLIFGKQISNLGAEITSENATDISIQNSTVTEIPTTSSSVVTNSNVTSDVTNTTLPPSTENPTTIAPATPSPAKAPSTGSWTVYDNDIACIKLEAAIQFVIPYEQTNGKNVTAYINVPKNASVDNNTCDNFTLFFNGNVFTINFKNESNEISATNFSLFYNMDEKDFPGAREQNGTSTALNLTKFEAPSGKSYLCKVETTIKMSDSVTLSMQDLRVEAFRNKTGDSFSDAKECSGDEKINDIVPIAVGCALAVLVIIVLIAYLVGRQRSRQQGYQSV